MIYIWVSKIKILGEISENHKIFDPNIIPVYENPIKN